MTKEQLLQTFQSKFPEKIEEFPLVGVDVAFRVERDLILRICRLEDLEDIRKQLSAGQRRNRQNQRYADN